MNVFKTPITSIEVTIREKRIRREERKNDSDKG